MPFFRALFLPCLLFLVSCSPMKNDVASKAETSVDPVATADDLFVHGTIETAGNGSSRTYRYRLLRPIDHDDDVPMPLLVFLHGMGERGSDNSSQLDYLPTWMCSPSWRERFKCYVLAVQCPDDEIWVGSWEGGGTSRALHAVEHAIEDLIEVERIDPSRVFLTGLSMGGYGSWALAAHRPDLFAAVVPICGGGDPSTVQRLRDLPIWVFHGTNDGVVSESESMEMVDAMRSAGIQVGYTRLQGVGHDSWTDAYLNEGAVNWLFSQQRR